MPLVSINIFTLSMNDRQFLLNVRGFSELNNRRYFNITNAKLSRIRQKYQKKLSYFSIHMWSYPVYANERKMIQNWSVSVRFPLVALNLVLPFNDS